jgi:hypothetical protein
VILDETTISDALHEATGDLTADSDLTAQVRSGGRRRLRRRRIGASIAVAATVAAIVPAAIALAAGNGNRQAVSVGGGPGSIPPAQSCTDNASGGGYAASPTAYPQLLMLPPGQPVIYAFTNTGGAPRCSYFPHVALTLLRERGGVVTQGVEVDGPDAPSTAQYGIGGRGSTYTGTTLHPRIDGQLATAFFNSKNSATNVFWSGTEGDQWHATVRGLDPTALDRLLGRLKVDPQAESATLPGAAAAGWTIAPPAPDASGSTSGVFYALWHEGRSRIALWVAPGPDRVDQLAAAGATRFVTVHGRPAVVSGRTFAILRWQVAKNVTAFLTMTHSSQATIQQVADTIRPISPTDPRLHRP